MKKVHTKQSWNTVSLWKFLKTVIKFKVSSSGSRKGRNQNTKIENLVTLSLYFWKKTWFKLLPGFERKYSMLHANSNFSIKISLIYVGTYIYIYIYIYISHGKLWISIFSNLEFWQSFDRTINQILHRRQHGRAIPESLPNLFILCKSKNQQCLNFC